MTSPGSRRLTDYVLVGPFLTRAQAAEHARIAEDELVRRPDLLHVGGRLLEEVYFAFQFDKHGIRRDLGRLVLALRAGVDDLAIADWLVKPHPMLGRETPLALLIRSTELHHCLEVAEESGPVADKASESPREVLDEPADAGSLPGRSSGRKHKTHHAFRRPAGSH